MKHPLLQKIDFAGVTGVTADSRQVEQGFIFVAVEGTQEDGASYIPHALERGASVVVCKHGVVKSLAPSMHDKALFVAYENPRQALSLIAAHYYKPQPDCLVAVTGTNGKTSVAEFTRQLWALTGLKSASVGTLGITTAHTIPQLRAYDSHALTTPDAVQLHQDLALLAQHAVDHVSLEASSIGLHMYRLDGLHLNAAAFTNISRDHLDYHETMQSYRSCKFRLFDELLSKNGTAVINANCTDYDSLFNLCTDRGIRVLTYGIGQGEIRTLSHKVTPYGFSLVLDILGRHFNVELPLLGDFQISNVLAAVGLLVACGSDPHVVARSVNNISGVKGRLQRVGRLPNGATAYVDFAHTPDGLETVLKSVLPHGDALKQQSDKTAHGGGKIHVVFGCGGDRDRGKRPLMAQVAAQYAHRVIVTDDNPRTEDAAQIRADIMAGLPSAIEISGREKAIEYALHTLPPNDILIIAGKGHEQGQIIGTQVYPFDDVAVTGALIHKKHHGESNYI